MKIITKLFLSLCLMVGLGATLTSNAQIESDANIRANIPHSFVVNNTTLPAGAYLITVPATSDLNVLEIRSLNGKTAVLLDTEPVKATRTMRQTELVFDKIGDTYFLSQVFLSGDEDGNQVVKSKMQRRLEEGGSVAESQSMAAEPVKAKSSKQAGRKMN